MYEYEEVEPVGLEETETCDEYLTNDEWNQILAIEIPFGAEEFDDPIEFPDECDGLPADEDLPEMDDIIHNLWDC